MLARNCSPGLYVVHSSKCRYSTAYLCDLGWLYGQLELPRAGLAVPVVGHDAHLAQGCHDVVHDYTNKAQSCVS